MFNDIYRGRRVLVTGHTGFKGSWLCAWLKMMGAELCGIALPAETSPSHSALLNLEMRSRNCDITDLDGLKRIFTGFQPEIVFHLAAQALVRPSYEDPVSTFASNVLGTVNVLEACRKTPSVHAVVAITSDKCYENREQLQGYKESDPMGGYDPYSASKGCSELVISSYRRSFFNNGDFGTKHHTLLASARAGNVIGGGDWAKDRLVPDLIRAAAKGEVSEIRSPHSTRPWQHVLEPLSGYLLLGEKLLTGETGCAEGWNFGPAAEGMITVEETAKALSRCWSAVQFRLNPPATQPHEAKLLKLDCSKALHRLPWHGVLSSAECFEMTAKWYKEFYGSGKLLTMPQIQEYIGKASERNLTWTK